VKINQVTLNYSVEVSCKICGNTFNLFNSQIIEDCDDDGKFHMEGRDIRICCDHEYSVAGEMDLNPKVRPIEEGLNKPEYIKGEFYRAKPRGSNEIIVIKYFENDFWFISGYEVEVPSSKLSWIDSQPLNLGD
jgi:hypothetical protein